VPKELDIRRGEMEMEVANGQHICRVRSPGYNYVFRKSDGFSMRWGRTLDDSPFSGPAPELADISISNRCSNGCPFCYRDSRSDGPLMCLEDYTHVMEQLPATFQVALGGGEPTEHPDFIDFLRVSRDFGKVPNYTTNGTRLTGEIIAASQKYCGAVAVSWSNKALDAVDQLVKGGVKTNLHFILSKSNVQVGLDLLGQPELFAKRGINAIVFLLHKAVGRGQSRDTPTIQQTRPLIVEAFSTKVPVGFDACSVPHIAAAEKDGNIKVDWNLLDSCDGSRFTVYVDESLNVSPCSFAKGSRFTESLREKQMDAIWNGEKFERFRRLLRDDSLSCPAVMVGNESE